MYWSTTPPSAIFHSTQETPVTSPPSTSTAVWWHNVTSHLVHKGGGASVYSTSMTSTLTPNWDMAWDFFGLFVWFFLLLESKLSVLSYARPLSFIFIYLFFYLYDFRHYWKILKTSNIQWGSTVWAPQVKMCIKWVWVFQTFETDITWTFQRITVNNLVLPFQSGRCQLETL